MRHGMFHSATRGVRHVCGITLKVAAAFLVFMVGLTYTLKYLGVPVPTAHELLRGAENLTRIF